MKVFAPLRIYCISPFFCFAPHIERIGAGIGLRYCVAALNQSLDHSRQVFLLLCVGAEFQDWRLTGPNVGIEGEQQSAILARVAQSFHGRDARDNVHAEASVLLGHGKALDTKIRALFPSVGIELAVFFPFFRSVIKLVHCKLNCKLFELYLFFCQ